MPCAVLHSENGTAHRHKLSFPQLTSSTEELPWQKGASCLNPSRCPGTKGYGLTMIRKIESKIFCPSAWSETAETAHVVHETTSLWTEESKTAWTKLFSNTCFPGKGLCCFSYRQFCCCLSKTKFIYCWFPCILITVYSCVCVVKGQSILVFMIQTKRVQSLDSKTWIVSKHIGKSALKWVTPKKICIEIMFSGRWTIPNPKSQHLGHFHQCLVQAFCVGLDEMAVSINTRNPPNFQRHGQVKRALRVRGSEVIDNWIIVDKMGAANSGPKYPEISWASWRQLSKNITYFFQRSKLCTHRGAYAWGFWTCFATFPSDG